AGMSASGERGRDGGAQGARPRMALDRYGNYLPVFPTRPVPRSTGFAKTCPFSPAAPDEDALTAELFGDAPARDAAVGRFRGAYVGAVAEAAYRERGSSGGIGSWILTELLRRDLVDGVAHVVPADPAREGLLFRYRISRTQDEVRAGAKSRYYPVELSGVLSEILAVPGRYAVVGVPCFIKAIQLLRRENPVLRERVRFTVGLFCGHMKSARFAESIAWQLGADVEDVAGLDFRVKDPTRPANTYTAQITLRDGRTLRNDWWFLADGDWGAGFFQNPACNACDDVVAEVADLSIGDAWVEPYELDGRGTNVVLTRSGLAERLIEEGRAAGRLALEPVDAAFVARTQAAGLRHRRQGLAYRMTWRRHRHWPPKRVVPGAEGLTLRRRLVYRIRYGISRWSHRVFLLARVLGWPRLYIAWARASLTIYQAVTYSRGRLGRWLDRVLTAKG
ncbi:MAG TPA: Coenzyme F420 hydrogenase/dehydrogenase, beta subunit C-terminal domain, partial [Longimicrobiales bacterium]|nr:Coenzyme F420 hydrogenase/dehydrogenase, beta subunit C-terminal domain [Longimicrobiales bacterium]